MEMTKRTVAPAADNKYYLHTSYGGFNSCIHIKDGSVLPNCVGYAWGRWYELLGEKPKLSRGNAENWYPNTSDGYKRGSTPKVGAVICWRKGKEYNSADGAGHVAIVEHVYSDKSILISQSAYGGKRFTTKTLKPPYSYGSAYTLQGFIYPPVNFTPEIKIDPAKSFDKTIAGTYKTNSALHIRTGAGTTNQSLEVMPKGAIVKNYGYYTTTLGIKWYYVTYNGLTGFCSSQYLTKV